MAQRDGRCCTRSLPDGDALIVKPDRRADDAAVADVFLSSQQPVHLDGDKASQRKHRTVADVSCVSTWFLEVSPRAAIAPRSAVAAVYEVRSPGPMKVVVKLPAEQPVRIKHSREPLFRFVLRKAVRVTAVLLPHHVHRLEPQRLANVRLRRKTVGRAEFIAQVKPPKAVRFVGSPLVHKVLHVEQDRQRLPFRIVKDNLPLSPCHLDNVFLRGTRLGCLKFFFDILWQSFERVVLTEHVIKQD